MRPIILLFVALEVSLVISGKTISERIVRGMTKCGKEVGIKSNAELTDDKLPCFIKCFMENGGLLDAAGKPHKENILRDIEAAAPAATKEAYKQSVEACIDKHGENLVPDDATCASYAALGMCTMEAIQTIRSGQM